MTIATTTPQPGTFGFFTNSTSIDVSAVEVLKAAPGAGLSIYVDHITLNSTPAIALSIGEGETVGGTVLPFSK